MNHSDRLYSIVLSKRYEMRCLTNSAFLFSGPSGRRKARQKDFLLRKAKVRGSESRDLMRIGRSFGEKKQAFAPKEVSVSRKCLLLFKISPNVFTHISCCSGILLLKCPIPLRLLVAKRALGGDKKLLLLRFAFSTGLLLCLSASYCMVVVRLAAKRIIG